MFELFEKVQLKSCPFCGSTPKLREFTDPDGRTVYYIECSLGSRSGEHKVRTGYSLFFDKAVEIWNTRFKGE